MAVWQYYAQLFPLLYFNNIKDTLNCLGQTSESVLYELDVDVSWGGIANISEITTCLDAFLSRNIGWDKTSMKWGDDSSNLVQILFSEGCVSEISVRFDMRHKNDRFEDAVMKFTKKINCFIVGEDRAIINNDGDLRNALTNSQSFFFVSDPKKYLNKLTEK